MAKKYYVGYMSAQILANHSTTKAFYTEYARGNWASGHNTMTWIPKSICRFDEPNECGNVKVYIPVWFFTKNQLDYMRCIDIIWCSNDEARIVEI